ncbi:peroxiredoxin Ahp1p [Trichomonascus vanleenenianus]|uniref:peroxiredoxin family protein n=1 Tax=Trichomonascus vanleenenianus TaxID=2268995 RepID=UPI003ECB4413
MSLKVGEGVKFTYVPYNPEQSEDVLACGLPVAYDCDKQFANKKVIIVSVPGAFTPACTANHIPPYLERLAQIKAKGVDEIIVISANDPHVLNAWGKALGAQGRIIFASDGNAAFSKSIGYSLDLSVRGLGVRNARYALVVDHGKVTYIDKEPGMEITVSGVNAVLSKL